MNERKDILHEGEFKVHAINVGWMWPYMDYKSKSECSFYWGNFAFLGVLMNDEEKLILYLDKYHEIVENGRKYSLYSSESAMVLMGCNEMIHQLEKQIVK